MDNIPSLKIILECIREGVVPACVTVVSATMETIPASGKWLNRFVLDWEGLDEPCIYEFYTPFEYGDENRPLGIWTLEEYLEDDAEFTKWVESELRQGRTPPKVEVCGRRDLDTLYVVLPNIKGALHLNVATH